MVTPQQLAARLRELRGRRELTQEALAEAADVSGKTIRRIEQGRGISPTLVTLEKVASAFGLTASEMLGDQLESREVAAMYRELPELEQSIAYVVLRSLTDHAAASH
ncbi:helix-turn-helix transcriptional regulator [Enhygromyxa salina]|uniref:Anaerobic benzoate catabolism transcriptional regulator n=1 Tax=Enhygromyxa salina TaxID=215803 RepID=A0A2S9Y092_9BACT|nr:helix-turn-helix transcriptional regulator [Enhygromyxa salina]PRP98524.1 anaerobic benzoate catabolism transcriptional regulator [Enhygromyxa salina]